MKRLGRIGAAPFRFLWRVVDLVFFGETPESRKGHEQRVADREARKRVERHGS
jgi:hypothetical protein